MQINLVAFKLEYTLSTVVYPEERPARRRRALASAMQRAVAYYLGLITHKRFIQSCTKTQQHEYLSPGISQVPHCITHAILLYLLPPDLLLVLLLDPQARQKSHPQPHRHYQARDSNPVFRPPHPRPHCPVLPHDIKARP
jgi:hypothetical protein